MSPVSRIPVWPDCAPGESLDSFLGRTAALNTIGLTAACEGLGLHDGKSFPPYWGVHLDETHRQRLVEAMNLTDDQADSMLLENYDQRGIDLSRFDPSDRGSLRRVMRDQWIFLAGSRFCPMCLGSRGWWRTAWKLPWSFVCLDHELMLVDVCPACGRRPMTGTFKSQSAPTFATTVADPIRCRNKQIASVGKRRKFRRCDAYLPDVESKKARPTDLASQRRINSVIGGSACSSLGYDVSSAAWFSDLRSVAVLLWRDRLVADTEADGGDDTTGHLAWTPPQSSALTAELIDAAFQVLDAPDVEAGAIELEGLVASLMGDGLATRNVLRSNTTANARICAVTEAVADRRARPTTRLRRRHTQLVLATQGLTYDDLTRPLPHDVLAELAPLVPVVAEHVLDTAARIGIAMLIGAPTYRDAAIAIGLPPTLSKSRARYCHSLLDKPDSPAAWAAGLEAIVHALAAARRTINDCTSGDVHV